MATTYVKSKSKTGRKPRTGNVYEGAYEVLSAFDGERLFILKGTVRRKDRLVADYKVFNSVAAAKKAGWVVWGKR